MKVSYEVLSKARFNYDNIGQHSGTSLEQWPKAIDGNLMSVGPKFWVIGDCSLFVCFTISDRLVT